MPLKIRNCRDQGDTIRAAARAACANASRITDPELQECIRKRCDNGTIECENDCERGLLGYAYRIPLLYRFKTIYICLNNILETQIADTILHEWAQTCGWRHGDGLGVPEEGTQEDVP